MTISKKGFTLIELVLVMSLLAILYSILVPNYNYYKNKVKEKSAIVYGEQINSTVIYSYGKNNGNYDTKIIRSELSKYTSIDVLDVFQDTEDNKNIKVTFKANGEQYKFNKNSLEDFSLINSKGKEIYAK